MKNPLIDKTSKKPKDKRLKQLLTIRDLLRYAVSRFNQSQLHFGHGSDNAFDEAVYLILKTLDLPIDQLEPFLDAKLLSDEVAHVLKQIDRRADEHMPAAYLTNEAFLGNYRFYVDERVIVPRSFIAELLREQFAPWIEDPLGVKHVLELCTGSGCLSILAAESFPNALINATDLSELALQVADINVRNYQLLERIRLIHSDVYAKVPKRKFDLIFSNPPYVNSDSMLNLPDEYRHEPQMALEGGADGMDIVRRIIAEAKPRLTRKGILVIEVGHERAHVEAAFPELPMTWLSTSDGDDMVFLIHAADLS